MGGGRRRAERAAAAAPLLRADRGRPESARRNRRSISCATRCACAAPSASLSRLTMPHHRSEPLALRLSLGLIRALRRLVPAVIRDEWVREWEAEIQHKWSDVNR